MEHNFFQKIKTYDEEHVIKITVIILLIMLLPLIIFATRQKQDIRQNAQAPQGVYGVYGQYDGTNINPGNFLATGWIAGVLYGGPNAVDVINNAPVYIGSHSIKYTLTAPYDELSLVAPQAFNIAPYTYLTFYAQAGSPGMLLGIKLIDANGQIIDPNGNGVPMSQYGGVPFTDRWGVYNIPITAFNLPSTNIKGIVFKDLNGGTQNMQPPPPIYIDEINFSTQQGQNISPPPGAAQISPPTAIPTPAFPYYPNISPWVFIIPGIIVGLAVIFQ